jgi:ACS family hexuronate transporter-like MFS transporter
MADPVWWFYLFWGAKFLHGKYGLNLQEIGIPFFSIYLLSWFGGIFFGWLSSRFLKTGRSLNFGRKMGLLASGVAAVPVMLVPHIDSLWISVLLIALAAGGHCGWSANIFSLMSDLFPKKATASVAGIGGFAGAAGGAVAALGVGHVLQNIGMEGYAIPFAVASVAYLIALLLIHLLVPVIKPVKL